MQENNAPATTENTNIALLPPADRAIIVLESKKTEAQLRELVALSADIVAVKDKDGREQAHRAAMNLRNARTAITKAGKAARDDANAFCAAVIAEEKRLVSISQPEEDRVFGLRDAFDAEEKRIKAEAERKEAERKVRIQGMIVAIRNIPVGLAGAAAADLATEIAELEGFTADEQFAEFADDANAAAQQALATLRNMHASQILVEAEAERVAAERAALEAERVERERVAAETKRQLEAQQAAIAEQRRQQEEALRAEREAFEAERRAFEEQKAAAARAEEERLAAERAAGDALVEATAVAAEERATDEEMAGLAMIHQGQVVIPAAAAEAQPEVAADAPIDTADEEAELALRTAVIGLGIVVKDLLGMGCTADQVRELVEIELGAAQKEAA